MRNVEPASVPPLRQRQRDERRRRRLEGHRRTQTRLLRDPWVKFKQQEIKDFLTMFLARDKGPHVLLSVKFDSKNLSITLNDPKAITSGTKLAPT